MMAKAAILRIAGPAVLAVVLVVAIVGITAGDPDPEPPSRSEAPARTGALPGGGDGAGCVEYTPEEATGPGFFAFDGTVVDVDGWDDSYGPVPVSFEVNEWFTGGDARKVTVSMAPPLEGTVPSYGIGSRLLVSGPHDPDLREPLDRLGLECGFTRYYDRATAEQWRDAA